MAANLVTKRQTLENNIITATGQLVTGINNLLNAWAELKGNGFDAGANIFVDADFVTPNDWLLATNFSDLAGVVTRLQAFVAATGTMAAGDFAKLNVVKRAQ
jgi:hypothetical protein